MTYSNIMPGESHGPKPGGLCPWGTQEEVRNTSLSDSAYSLYAGVTTWKKFLKLPFRGMSNHGPVCTWIRLLVK